MEDEVNRHIEEFASAIGIELLPWQKLVIRQVLMGKYLTINMIPRYDRVYVKTLIYSMRAIYGDFPTLE